MEFVRKTGTGNPLLEREGKKRGEKLMKGDAEGPSSGHFTRHVYFLYKVVILGVQNIYI